MSILIDTNIPLRSAQPTHALCGAANRAVTDLLRQGRERLLLRAKYRRVWNAATRSVSLNGLGLSNGQVWSEVLHIEALFTLLPDVPAIYPEWKRLVRENRVQGVKVFDPRLVAAARVHGVETILTFNVADFRRYDDIAVLDPLSFVS